MDQNTQASSLDSKSCIYTSGELLHHLSMMFGGLVFYTQSYEEYLSFLTEVLELEVDEISDSQMRLALAGQFLEIRKEHQAQNQQGTTLVFNLSEDKFFDLVARLSFFYYRHDSSRFLLSEKSAHYLEIKDPEGRIWRFEKIISLARGLSSQL